MRTFTGFAGAGLADIGLTDAGCEHVRCVEWDDAAARTLKAAGFPAWHGDIREPACTDGLGPIDLAWFSPPCQVFSSAGKREGADADRNGFPWAFDAIDRMRGAAGGPRWAIMENVPGLLHHRGAHCKPECCRDPSVCPATYFHEVVLREMRSRFAWVGWRVLDAASFGTPQFRRRVFVVGGPRPIDWPEPTHGDPATLGQVDMFRPRLLPWVSCGEALGLTAPIVGGGSNPRGKGAAAERTFRRIEGEPSTTVAAVQVGNAGPWVYYNGQKTAQSPRPGAGPYGKRPAGTMVERQSCASRPADSITSSVPQVGRMTHIRTEQRGATGRAVSEPSPTVPTGGNQYLHDGDPGTRAGSEPERLGRPAPTMAGGDGTSGAGQWSASESLRHEMERQSGRRRLTVAECSILMGAPADYPYQGNKAQRYQQCGNGVVPVVAQRLAEAVMRADQ